jgi:hypothetical protein
MLHAPCTMLLFILADPTDIPRPQAKKTEYVGRLKDGKTRGFQVLVLAVPYRGRAIPFHFITYSSKTMMDEGVSRNIEHRRALRELKEIIGDKPLVMDREFSYEGLISDLVEEGINFVCRLNVSNNPKFTDEEGNEVTLTISPGEKVFYRGLYYKGKIKVNVAGKWDKGFKEAIWIITSLDPEEGLLIYEERVKIEESFRDLKRLLNLEKIMSKKRENMEKVIALVLMAYAIGLLVGEALRDRMYGGDHTDHGGDLDRGDRSGGDSDRPLDKGGGYRSDLRPMAYESGGNRSKKHLGNHPPWAGVGDNHADHHRYSGSQGKKWKLYSGLFVLLRHKIRLGKEVIRQMISEVIEFFRRLVLGYVRSYV